MCVYTLACLYTHPFQITTFFKIYKYILRDIFYSLEGIGLPK